MRCGAKSFLDLHQAKRPAGLTRVKAECASGL